MNLNSLTDNELLGKFVNHDRQAISYLYDLLLPDLTAFILSNSGQRSDAEDIFQEGLLVLYKMASESGFEIKYSIKSYFSTICRNIWFNRLKKNKREEFYGDWANDEIKQDGSLHEMLEQNAQMALYKKHFLLLNEKCKQILEMYFKGKKMKEIADTLDMASEGYVRKKKYECKQSLFDSIQNDPMYEELKVY